VVVQNSTAQPVPTTNPLNFSNQKVPLLTSEALEPYEDSCSFDFNGQGGGFCTFRTIPDGKRLVIEEFDAATGFPPRGLENGCKPLTVTLNVSGQTDHFFPATHMATDPDSGLEYYVTHQQTRLYQPELEVPQCNVTLTCFSHKSYRCQISGFLVAAH
jgi:hypothetical protein